MASADASLLSNSYTTVRQKKFKKVSFTINRISRKRKINHKRTTSITARLKWRKIYKTDRTIKWSAPWPTNSAALTDTGKQNPKQRLAPSTSQRRKIFQHYSTFFKANYISMRSTLKHASLDWANWRSMSIMPDSNLRQCTTFGCTRRSGICQKDWPAIQESRDWNENIVDCVNTKTTRSSSSPE